MCCSAASLAMRGEQTQANQKPPIGLGSISPPGVALRIGITHPQHLRPGLQPMRARNGIRLYVHEPSGSFRRAKRHPHDHLRFRCYLTALSDRQGSPAIIALFDDTKLLILSRRSLALSRSTVWHSKPTADFFICFRLVDHSYVLKEE